MLRSNEAHGSKSKAMALRAQSRRKVDRPLINAEMPDWDQIAIIQNDRVIYKGLCASGLRTVVLTSKG